jgi:hypothetical protein
MPSRTTPIRRGKAVFFTLDLDAAALLEVMVPNSKGRGCFCSELIRKEARERATRPLLEELLSTLGPRGK